MRRVRKVAGKLLPISLLAASASANAAIVSTVEAAGVQATTLQYVGGMVSFDTLSTGYRLFDYVNVGNGLNAIFSPYTVSAPSNLGGAHNTRFMTVNGSTTVTLSDAVNYVGLWGAALDGGNSIELLMNGSSVGSYNLLSTPLTSAYYGNPNNRQNLTEPYAFFNFVSDVAFNQVRLLQNGGGGFELDNLTFGNYRPPAITPVPDAVPEPATLGVLLLGLGMIAAARTRRLAPRPPLP